MFRSITEPEDDEVEVLHVTDCLIKADQPSMRAKKERALRWN